MQGKANFTPGITVLMSEAVHQAAAVFISRPNQANQFIANKSADSHSSPCWLHQYKPIVLQVYCFKILPKNNTFSFGHGHLIFYKIFTFGQASF